jgi:mannose-1-phosphate guanylyltransferase
MNKNNTYVAIMAGGVGSRFWPASRSSYPKQFLDILGVGKSLIRLTYERFLKLCPSENILIVTNKRYRELVKEHLPELDYSQILCEPSMNNTAPCVAYTALRLKAMNENANFIVAPSDHVILKEDVFISKLETALDFTTNNDALVTLGITPTRPDTGYGYINFGENVEGETHKVKRFMEKPDLETAQQFLDSGDYLWNAGIFVWNVDTLLKSYRQNAPEILDILEKGAAYYNTDKEQEFIDEAYPNTPKISVDYAIMEKADNIYTIPSDIGWSDLGTWNSLYSYRDKDENGNVTTGKVILKDTKDCFIRTKDGKLTVIKGLEDFIVVDEGDILLVYPKKLEQEIKGVVGAYKKDLPEYF